MKKKSNRIPSAGPSITMREVRLIADAAKTGWYENRNDYLNRFNKKFGALTKRRFVLPTAHCTDAIHLALLTLGIGKGDEVIVPDISWIASASPITYVGATPVFADIEEANWCLSPESLERAITKRTKAVVVVHTYGSMARIETIMRIAKKHQLAVIEDAAEALGSSYHGRPAGSFGDVSVMSFNATKIATAGQGGVFATNDKALYEKARRFVRHGMVPYTPNRTFWADQIGYNYEWTNMQAAFALGQLERLPELVRFKHRAFSWYQKYLHRLPLTLNPSLPRTRSNHWLAVALFDRGTKVTKEAMVAFLQKSGIDGRPFFYPMSSMPAFRNWTKGKGYAKRNPISYDLSRRGLCLPSAFSLTSSQVKTVAQVLRQMLARR